jgi:hypothetical protein
LLFLAALHTLGNIAKPLHIDDAAYYYYARQTAQKPFDPYGFQVFWWDNAEGANEVLAPPLLSYWWSLFMRIDQAYSWATGVEAERPWLWKLGMVPFSLLFIGCVYALFRRFACGLEMPLTWLTVLSPAFWPSLNLMLDIPTLALSLCALLAFMRACEQDSAALAALAGLVAGLALEMKYTAILTSVVFFLYAVCLGKVRLWPVSAIVAAQGFVVWELLMAMLYGESHFLYHARYRVTFHWLDKISLLLPMLSILGSLGPAMVLLALKGLRTPWPFLLVLGLMGLGGYALVALIEDNENTRLLLVAASFGNVDLRRPYLSFQECWFGAWGALLATITSISFFLCVINYSRRAPTGLCSEEVERRRCLPRHCSRVVAFLALWLLLEIAEYIALTPFPAVRRVMGVVIVGTLVVGCLTARICRTQADRNIVWAIAGYGMILGAGFAALDWRDAQAEKEAVERSVAFFNERGGGRVWFASHWGFQYYAERAGMEMISPNQSRLKEGDWVVYPRNLTSQHVDIKSIPRESVAVVEIGDSIRLQTVWCYYIGYTAVENRSEPRVTVEIYRVTAACIPRSSR